MTAEELKAKEQELNKRELELDKKAKDIEQVKKALKNLHRGDNPTQEEVAKALKQLRGY